MHIETAAGFSLEMLARLFTAGFSDYFVPVRVDAVTLGRMVCRDHIDLAASRVAVVDGRPAGLALVATRGRSARVAAMGVLGTTRRAGAGRALLRAVIEQAGAAGFERLLLEVITDNAPAIALYRAAGFEPARRLVGWQAPPGPGRPAALEEVDPRVVARAVARFGPDDPPWQLAPSGVAASGPPALGFCLERAVALVDDPGAERITLRALAGPSAAGRRRLLHALRARFSDRMVQLAPVWPEDDAPQVFREAGFTPTALTQWEMVRRLSAAAR